MSYSSENNIIDLFTEGYQDDGVPHTVHMRLNADSLETESSSDLTQYIDSTLSVNHSVIKGQSGFFIASEKVITGEIKGIYSFDSEDNFLFSRDDFADDSLPEAAVMTPDGSISLITAENDYNFEIEKLNMYTGEFTDYFSLKSDEKIISFKGINSEKYDLIYETESGYYGFAADSGYSELISENGGSDITYTAVADNKLIFFSQSDNSGYYVNRLDENGELAEDRYRLWNDEKNKNLNMTDYFVMNDGIFFSIAFDHENADADSYLVSTDREGKTIKRVIEIPDKYKGIKISLGAPLVFADDRFYTVAIYEESNRVCEISPEGKILTVSPEDKDVVAVNNIVLANDGRILLEYMREGTYDNVTAWYESGKKVSENYAGLPSGRMFSGYGKYLYLYANSDGLYGYTSENSIEEIVCWLDTDFRSEQSSSNMDTSKMFFDSKGSFYDCWGSRYANDSSILIKYEPCETTENKTVITVAADSDSISFRELIRDFNQKNEDYRIKLINYKNLNSFSENGMLSSDSLTADLSAGKIPDLIITDSKGAMQLYQDMGMLADLKPFIENDSEISYDDYFENIFDAFSDNGRMYQLCVNFGISGMTGSRETLGEERNWTRDEFLDFAESYDEVFLDATADTLKGELLSYEGFTDFKNHTCSFDSESFVRILKLIKSQGISKQEYEERFKNHPETYLSGVFVNGNCLVENIELYNMSHFDMMEKAYFKNGASFIGNPVENNGPPMIYSGIIVGITKKSSHHNTAWEFARRFIMDEYQDKVVYEQFQEYYPVKYSTFEKLVSKALSGKYSISTEFYDGRLRNTGALKKEDAERLEGFIRSANKVYRNDERIKNILSEETDLFLADEQTAEEAAENIQKKVKTYLNEIK